MDFPKEVEDRAIRFQLKMLQAEASVQNKIDLILRDLTVELKQTMEGLDPTVVKGDARKAARVERLIDEAESVIQEHYKQMAKTLQAELIEVADVSQEMTKSIVNDVLKINLMSETLDFSTLKQLARDTLIDGAPSKTWWAKQGVDLQDRFAREIRKGMAAGESIGDMVRRIRGYTPRGKAYVPGIMDVTTREAAALVRTSVLTVSNSVRMETFRANSKVVRGVQWVSTLDSRTTLICRVLDGLTWDLEMKPIGHDRPFPGPTAHWGCRSTQIPLLNKWSDMLDDPVLAKKLDTLELDAGTRASIGGPVKQTTNYESWLKGQSKEQQIEILGKARYDLWTNQKMSLSRMVDQRNNPKTLKEIRGSLGGKKGSPG